MKRLGLVGLALILVTAHAAQWQAVPDQSRLTFQAEQAGAQFEGAFRRFTAKVDFDPHDPARCAFDVTIEMASVDTQDDERDTVLRGADLFDIKHFPQARYVANRCSVKGRRFIGSGKLTMRKITRDVPIMFTLDGNQTLKGSAQLQRLDFGVGQGEWSDTEWVGNDVRVMFTLKLQKKA